jgi:thioesterase domain-containing protein
MAVHNELSPTESARPRPSPEAQGVKPAKIVLALRREGSQPPVFCMHPGSGFGLSYLGLLPHLDPEIPIYAIQARGLADPAELPQSIDAMVDDYVSQVRLIQPTGPYRLLGWCIGGRLAFEIATVLGRFGEAVDLLATICTYPPLDGVNPDPRATLISMLRTPGTAPVDPELEDLCGFPLDYARINTYLKRTGHTMSRLNERTLNTVFEIYRNNARLVKQPIESRYDGDMICFVASEQTGVHRSIDEWRPYVTGNISSYTLTGHESQMTEPGPLAEIGRIVDKLIMNQS